MRTTSLFAALAVMCALVMGCGSTKDKGYKPSAKARTSLENAAQQIDKANYQVDTALATLNTVMQAPGKLSGAFEDYSRAVADLEETQREIAGKVTTMREKSKAFFSQWEQDVATIRNEDVRTRSEARKNELNVQFDKMRADYQAAQKAIDPFVRDLRDIRTALSVNLTLNGVASVKDLARKANAEGTTVHQALNTLSADFRQLGVAVATTMPSTTPAATRPVMKY